MSKQIYSSFKKENSVICDNRSREQQENIDQRT